MTIAYYGKNTSSNPRYIAAVRAQQEKSRSNAVSEEVQARGRRDENARRAEQLRIQNEYERTQRLHAEYRSERPSVASIIATIAVGHGLTPNDLKGPTRLRNVIEARFDAYVEIYLRRTDLSMVQIGRALGGRDHTSVHNALRKRGIALRGPVRVDDAAILRVAASGLTQEQVAAAAGCSRWSVRRVLKGAGR